MIQALHVVRGSNHAVGTLSRGESIRQDIDVVTARIIYRFGGPVVAKY